LRSGELDRELSDCLGSIWTLRGRALCLVAGRGATSLARRSKFGLREVGRLPTALVVLRCRHASGAVETRRRGKSGRIEVETLKGEVVFGIFLTRSYAFVDRARRSELGGVLFCRCISWTGGG
jgi:hypothetical protein